MWHNPFHGRSSKNWCLFVHWSCPLLSRKVQKTGKNTYLFIIIYYIILFIFIWPKSLQIFKLYNLVISLHCTVYTVRKEMKCSGESEILHELVHDTIGENWKVMNSIRLKFKIFIYPTPIFMSLTVYCTF